MTLKKEIPAKKPVANSTFAIGGVSSSLDSFVVIESSVLRTNFCAKKPAHRQSANRYENSIRAVKSALTSLEPTVIKSTCYFIK